MGSLFGSLTGGSQQRSQATQTNQAFPYLSSALSPIIGTGGQAGSQIANMLGLNGPGAQAQGFNNWKNSTGYQFGLNQGVQSIVGNQATQGLLNSGGTAKAIDTYGQNYANTQYGNYMGMLQQLLGSGLQGGSVLSSAGNTFNSSSSGSSTNGLFGSQGSLGGFIGSLLEK